REHTSNQALVRIQCRLKMPTVWLWSVVENANEVGRRNTSRPVSVTGVTVSPSWVLPRRRVAGFWKLCSPASKLPKREESIQPFGLLVFHHRAPDRHHQRDRGTDLLIVLSQHVGSRSGR